MMKRHLVSQESTLGIQPDLVLEWIIEGRLVVAFQGSEIRVDSNQSLKNPSSDKILILTKQPSQR